MKDITGQRFGRLTVEGVAPRVEGHVSKCIRWHAVCDCGNRGVFFGNNLRTGNSTSCGCAHREINGDVHRTHGQFGKPIYIVWSNMRLRCDNPRNKSFKNYGGRGITYAREWATFAPFWAWAKSSGYAPGLTLERIDVNGNYEPGNCTWATATAQARNRRNARRRADGVPWTDIAEQHGISSALYSSRVCKGWDDQTAATTPKSNSGGHGYRASETP